MHFGHPAAALAQGSDCILKRPGLSERVSSVLLPRRFISTQMGKSSGHMKIPARKDALQRIDLRPALPQAVHTGVDFDLHLQRKARLIQAFSIRGIQYRLGQPGAVQQRYQPRMRIAQHKDLTLHAAPAQLCSLPGAGHAKSPYAKTV